MKRIITPAIALALLSGCTGIGPAFQRPVASVGAAYSGPQSPLSGPEIALGEGPQERWWEVFGSSQINGLVDRALAGNQNLAASVATLERARQHLRSVNGHLLPQVDGNARAVHQKISLAAYGLDPASFGAAGSGFDTSPEFSLYSVGGGVTYDLDLFGANHRASEQAAADAEAQLHETQAAHLTIAGRVVMQALMIAALNDRISAQTALIAEDERNVTLTERKLQGGIGTMVEVLAAQQQRAADKASLPQIEQQRNEAHDLLAVLIGIPPAELGPITLSLNSLSLPSQVPVTLPSELAHKRPDILAAEARLHAATAGIGMAEAKLYPSIMLGASFEQMAQHPDDLFKSPANTFNLFGGLTAPVFHGGTLRANKRGAEAEVRASAARYRQAVLEAFGQVSDLLSAISNDSQSLALQSDSAALAERSLGLSRRSFAVGNSGVLQVLDASRSVERAKIALVEARARQYINLTRLYVATAGGWTGPAKP